MPTKDKKQYIYVSYCPEFVSGGPEFVSGFPVAYGRKGRLLLTLLLRVLDFAFAVLVILLQRFKKSGYSLAQGGRQCSDRRALCWRTPNKRSALGHSGSCTENLPGIERPSSRCAPSTTT